MDKYEYGPYHKSYFLGGSNVDLTVITCEDKLVIPSILQKWVLHWWRMYLLNLGMYRTEAIIRQNLCYPGIRYAVREELTNGDTCQRTKLSNKNMLNYQLRNLIKYHGKNLCRYNMPIRHKKKGTERKLKSKIHYHDRPCNMMVWKQAIWQQKSDINRELSWN